MPTTQLERGWMNTNAMTIIDVAEKKLVNTVLLDNVDLGAAMPWGVETSADGKTIFVTHAGTHELSVIDAEALLDKVLNMPKTKEEAREAGRYDDRGSYSSVIADDVPNDLAFLVGMRRRIRLRGGGPYGLLPYDGPAVNGPRGLDVIGTKVYVAIYFYDLLAVVDLEDKSYHPVKVIRLGPEPEFTVQRRGEMIFHDADICFQHWQSCASCHPDARVDGLNWDLMNDGMGNPKNVRSMLLALDTPPSMASGVRPDGESSVRSGVTHILFAVRPEEEHVAMDEYIKALEPVPSPYLVNGQLSEAAKRGKELFFSERINCAECHPEPLYTDLQLHDVASRGKYDRRDDFDTPTLIECWRTAPYMHDGSYVTLKDLIAKGKHGKFGGDVEGMTEQEINDLVEFVLSL
jgi:mono/diheme cytochrome c family protein